MLCRICLVQIQPRKHVLQSCRLYGSHPATTYTTLGRLECVRMSDFEARTTVFLPQLPEFRLAFLQLVLKKRSPLALQQPRCVPSWLRITTAGSFIIHISTASTARAEEQDFHDKPATLIPHSCTSPWFPQDLIPRLLWATSLHAFCGLQIKPDKVLT